VIIIIKSAHHSVPPDHSLASKQMAGKKKEKFRITMAFACNADRSEHLPPIYIGKSKKPLPSLGSTTKTIKKLG